MMTHSSYLNVLLEIFHVGVEKHGNIEGPSNTNVIEQDSKGLSWTIHFANVTVLLGIHEYLSLFPFPLFYFWVFDTWNHHAPCIERYSMHFHNAWLPSAFWGLLFEYMDVYWSIGCCIAFEWYWKYSPTTPSHVHSMLLCRPLQMFRTTLSNMKCSSKLERF